MLENFRKYTGLMFVVLILLFVGLIFFADNASKRGYGQGSVVVEVDGRGYTEQEQQRLAVSPLRLLSDLSNMRTRGYRSYLAIMPYMSELATSTDGSDMDPTRFLVNRLLLQKGMKQFGVYPSDADVQEFQRETLFAKPDGSFDQEAYDKYVERSLPRLGMSLKDMNELLREVLALRAIQDIVGAGLTASTDTVRESVEDRQQQIDYQLLTFPASNYEAAQEPTEEQIKEYWEENKGAYQSDAQRSITYVLASPDFDALLEEKKKAAGAAAPDQGESNDDPADTESPDADTAESTADDTTDKPEEPAITLTQEERADAVKELVARLDTLWSNLQKNEGEDFAKLAEQEGFEMKSTELFTKDTAPAEFKRSAFDAPGKRVVDLFFERDAGLTGFDAVSDVHYVTKEELLLWRDEQSVEPKELTYEEAKEEAKLDLVKKLAREAMDKAAEDARTKLAAALEEGKSFKDAAAELELTPVTRTAVTTSTRTPGEPTPAELFDLASKVNPGNLSEILTQNNPQRGINRAVFVFVDKRELVDSEANRNMVDQRVNGMGSAFRRVAMTNWLNQQYAAANVKQPALK